jgi:cytochrome c553
MKIFWFWCAFWAVIVLAAVGALGTPMAAQNSADSTGRAQGAPRELPIWAYPVPFADRAPNPNNIQQEHVPGSAVGLTAAEIADLFSVPDWFPDSHPPMPQVVARGTQPARYACGYCHLPNGQGRPENASVAGLPAQYIVKQMADFKSGMRKSSEPQLVSATYMVDLAKETSEDEAKAAAAYFSALKLKPWIRVVETGTVPKTRMARGMLVPTSGGTESIGERVIEVPEDFERTELRDSTSGFVAYVPVGSIQKGAELVMTGGAGKTIPCSVCHGPDLRGMADVPSIAGRSPSQMARQIIDIQTGARHGQAALLMKPVVNQLGNDDIVNIIAYLSSLKP